MNTFKKNVVVTLETEFAELKAISAKIERGEKLNINDRNEERRFENLLIRLGQTISVLKMLNFDYDFANLKTLHEMACGAYVKLKMGE